jgi:peptide/nickel transport system substrate-binding protein
LGRYLRWQAVIAILGIALLAALLRYTAHNFTSVTVPDHGGELVEGMAGNPQFLNPLLSQYNQVDGVLASLLFNGLTRLDERGNVVPDLAETMTISPDGLTYDFKLRSGLYWHDGVPVTANDVLYTVKAMQGEEFPGMAWLSALWREVEAAAPDGPDGLTVRFQLKQPFAPFIDYTTIGLLPAHLWQEVPVAELMSSQYNTRPIGTGPFQLENITATEAKLKTNPTYHGSKPPFLDGITIRFYPDHQSLIPAYERGEIDAISWLWPEDMAKTAELEDMNLFSAPISGYTLIYLNHQNPNTPFFKDVAVRKALLYGLDRQRLVDTVLKGQGMVAHSPIMPYSWAYDQEIAQYGYDPAAAQQVLDQAGWVDADGDGVREREGIQLAFVLLGNDKAKLDAISAMWAEIGVNAEPQAVSLPGLTADFLAPRAFDAALVDWELSGDPDPYPLWHSTQAKTGQNYAGWESRRADEAIERARALPDHDSRIPYYKDFQRIFSEEVPSLLLYYPMYTYGVRSKVRDAQMGPLNTPGDRYRSIANWYIVTKRVTVGSVGEQPVVGPAPSRSAEQSAGQLDMSGK